MKLCVIVIMSVYAAATSAATFSVPKNLYEVLYGKCQDVSKHGRHPVQLNQRYNGRCSVQSDGKTLVVTECDGRQHFQYYKSNCKR